MDIFVRKIETRWVVIAQKGREAMYLVECLDPEEAERERYRFTRNFRRLGIEVEVTD